MTNTQPKTKGWFSFTRYIVTNVLCLIVSLLAALGPYGQGLSAAFAALAVPATYTLLMLLLWLYERFPPGKGA
jgi:hypothetical protein